MVALGLTDPARVADASLAELRRAILAGDTETGVSIMQLTAGLDSGPVCLQERIAIEQAGQHVAAFIVARAHRIDAPLHSEQTELRKRRRGALR